MNTGQELSGPLAELAGEILADDRVDARDLARLKAAIGREGAITREEAELLFHINDASRGNDPGWKVYFVRSLTDHVFAGQEAPFSVSEEDGRFLAERISRDGRIDGRTEFDLLVDIVAVAETCPEALVKLALEALKESVLAGGGVLFGKGRRRRGVIDDADVDIVRRVIHGGGGERGAAVSRDEAEILFELNNATAEKENSPAWQGLFVEAIANYLLFEGETPDRVDRAEAAWLIAQVTDDDILHDNEKALLVHLLERAEVDPSLQPLLAKFEL